MKLGNKVRKLKNLMALILIGAAFFVPTISVAQPKNYIEHYGSEDGLPQNTVMDMLQDHNGTMWFSTWDGLCKFDGYKFTPYRNPQDNPYPMRSNRIDYIMEDNEGYIWTLSYDNEAHRFDPRTSQFMGIRSLEGYENYTFFCDQMVLMPSGKVWLISKDKGCVSVYGEQFEIGIYNSENNKIADNRVRFVFEDSEQNSWILTKSGVYAYSKDDKLLTTYAVSGEKRAFYSAEEINGEVWLGSSGGQIVIYNPKSRQFRQFELTTSDHINGIELMDEYRVLITSKGRYFFIYDTKNDLLERHDVTKGLGERGETIAQSHIDGSKRIWFELDRLGTSMFDTQSGELHHFSRRIESPIVNVTAPLFLILEDASGNTWVHPKGGGFSFYDPKTNKLVPFYNEPNSADWRFSAMLHSGFIDNQNNLWLGTHSRGLEKVVFSDEIFTPMQIDKFANNPMSNSTRCVFEDRESNLWISTKDGKTHLYDRNKEYMGYLSSDGRIGKGNALPGIAYSMTQDNRGNLWLGTKGNGIYKIEPQGGYRYNITNFQYSSDNPYSLSSNNVYSIFQDSKERIWVGCYGGGLNLMLEDGRFINHRNLLINYPMNYGSQVRVIAEDAHGNICLGTTLGLIMFSSDVGLYNNIEFKFYIKQAGSELSLTANDVYDIVTTKAGDTYFATFGGGVNKISQVDKRGFPTKFVTVAGEQGLSSGIALQIAEDHEGKLWISSEGNITIYNPADDVIKSHSEIAKIIKGSFFTEGSKFVSRTGIIYFGFSDGVLTINPHIVKESTFKPYLALTNLQIANRDVTVGENSALQMGLDYTERLKLNHRQNSFNIEFAAMDYEDTKQIEYAYMLEGFDKDWVSAGEQRMAIYNNLQPGEYLFRVKSTNSDRVWVENQRTLPVVITPSFWQTNLAIVLYIVVVGAILAAIFRSLFIYYRLKDRMNLEQEEIEMKTRFFMDISHEIRTPLTMVVSPIENILEGEHTVEEVKSQLGLVLKNANRMLRMVNQILDFRKIEKSRLNIQNTLIGNFIDDVAKNFSRTAEIEHVGLKVHNMAPQATLWVDRDNIEKLLFNLLSNAIRHTPTGKKIDVSVYEKGDRVLLEVKDEGVGMNKEIRSKLFTRFSSFSLDKSKPSTGIGLSIVKEIVDKHKAEIEVQSDENRGSRFIISFQKGNEHFTEEAVELVSDDEQITELQHAEKKQSQAIESPSEERAVVADFDEKATILVVEDDTDLRGYIVKVLEKHYTILEAEDGEEGYKTAVAEMPDFILSDIMMPNVDGVEFLQRVKANTDTSHIPFILLTAKVDMESRLQGLKYGADDYITKPFSVKYLKARITNIIEQRRLLYQSYFSDDIAVPPIVQQEQSEGLEVITSEDKEFVRRVKEFIEENVDNSDFVVEDIANEMLVSRTVFFKKMKSLTGLAPIEFIREVKVKHAAQVIADTDYTIKEIAFMIGISDTKYFTRWFKKIIGMTPSEYRRKNKPS